jgi:hypothetical protein
MVMTHARSHDGLYFLISAQFIKQKDLRIAEIFMAHSMGALRGMSDKIMACSICNPHYISLRLWSISCCEKTYQIEKEQKFRCTLQPRQELSWDSISRRDWCVGGGGAQYHASSQSGKHLHRRELNWKITMTKLQSKGRNYLQLSSIVVRGMKTRIIIFPRRVKFVKL